MEEMEPRETKDQWYHPVIRDLGGPKEYRVIRDLKANKVLKVSQEIRAQWDHQVKWDLGVLRDQRVNRVASLARPNRETGNNTRGRTSMMARTMG